MLNNQQNMESTMSDFGVWCTVSGGITGHREAWLKKTAKSGQERESRPTKRPVS